MKMSNKLLSLISLSVQNAMFAISIRYSRIRTDKMFLASTAVINTEILKFLTSLYLLYQEEDSFKSLKQTLVNKIYRQPIDTLKVCVPSFVYVVQNNLLYFGASHLDSATFQITFQLKILTTALFSVVLLQKKLLSTQWLALLILLAGVILVELSDSKEGTQKKHLGEKENRLIGFIAVLGAACCSGFAGVYFERILKGTASVSLWLRNVQLAFCSIPIGLFTCVVYDWNKLNEKGFFYGYDSFVVYVIALQGVGGILVGLVVKYADNLLKGFAAASAIVMACIASMVLFDFQITKQFVFGTFMIIISIFLYGHQPSTAKSSQSQSSVTIHREPVLCDTHELNTKYHDKLLAPEFVNSSKNSD